MGASRCWGNRRQPRPVGFPEGMVWERVIRGLIQPRAGRGLSCGKLLGARQSRGGHCACCLSAGLGKAGRVQAELWWDLLLPRVLPGFVHPCWGLWGPQGCVNPTGKAGMQIPQADTLDKPSEAAQAGRYWLLVGSTEELLWFAFTKFSGIVILRNAFSLLDM